MFCARFFVTLEEITGFLYIKAMQRIEKIQGYEIETVLIFTNIKVVGNDEVVTGKIA